MKTYPNLKRLAVLPVILVALLTLSACNLPFLSSQGTAAPAATNPAATMAPAGTAAAPASDAGTSGGGSCLVGNWQLTNYPEYIASLTNLFSGSSSSSETSINDQGNTGLLNMKFAADGTASFAASNFDEKFTMSHSSSSGSSVDVPIEISMNGTSTSAYSVSNDEISFSNQNPGDLKITVTMMGNPTPIDADLLGQQGTVTVYKYTCLDANTLSLKVIVVDRDLAPLKFTRVP
jgi:hypothetical protein